MPDGNRQLNHASDVIWNWKPSGNKPRESNAAALRRKGLIQAVGAALVGSLFWYLGLHTMAYVAFTIAVIVLIAATVSPTGVFATLNRGADKLGLFIGNCIKWTFLPAVYYLFFLPFGKIFRRGDKDTLKRKYQPNSSTYWVKRRADSKSPSSRSNQF